MQRRVPRWAWWIGVPVLLLVLLVVFWSWNWFIPLVERQASAALGRPVTIAGLHVRPGRVTEITVDGPRIANPPGITPDPPFAEAERLVLRVDVMAWWRDGSVVLPEIALTRPVVRALALEDGTNNYTFALGGADTPPPAGEDAPPPDPSRQPRIGVLRITDGAARAVIPRLRADFEIAAATRDETTPEPRIQLTARGTYAGQPVTAALVAGGPLALLSPDTPWPVEFEVANGPTRASLQGTVRNPLALQGADLRLQFSGPDMALLEPLTGVPIPQTPNYEVTGRLDYASGRVRFREMQGRLGSSDIAGDINVTVPAGTGNDKPLVEAELRSRRVDLADLGGFIGETPGRASTPGQSAQQRREQAQAQRSPRLLPDTPINFPKLDAANVRLSYRAASIIGRDIPFDRFGAEMTVQNSAIALRPITFGVGQGQILGNIALNPADDGRLRAEVDVELQRLDVSRLMAPTGFQGAGTLGGRARLQGTGRSMADILGGGDGALNISMAGGGNLSALLVDLSGLRLGNAVLSLLQLPDRTQVGCLVADFGLRRGVLNTNAFVVDTEDVVITGTGTVDLGRERLALRVRSDSKGFTIGQLPAPITVGGTFRDPDVGIEAEELVARGGIAGALGFLAAPLAILPTIQFGVGEDNRCAALSRRAAGRR